VKLLKAIRDFSYGIVDSFGRGKEPEGSFADSRNLIPLKSGSTRTIHGYESVSLSSHVSAVTALPTGFTEPETSGTFDITKIVETPFFYSSEYPTAHDGRVYFVKDDNDAKHVMLDSWHDASGLVTTNNGFVLIDERKKIAYTADVTIASSSSNQTITVANAATHGLSTVNDYYNGWRIELYDPIVPRNQYAMITDYAVVTGTATITVSDDIGTDYSNWAAWDTGYYLYLRRWFHSSAARSVDWGTRPGAMYSSEGRIRGCGGSESSDDSYEPYWIGYIDRIFFNGVLNPEDASAAEIHYKGTYVDNLEVTGGIVEELVGSGAIPVVYRTGSATDADKDFAVSAVYQMNYTFEYDGYQESELRVGHSMSGAPGQESTNYQKFVLSLHLATLSKRVTALNIYAQQWLAGVWSESYFIRRIPIDDSTVASSWKYRQEDLPFANAHTTASLFTIDGETIEHAFAQLTGPDWDNKGATYYQRTGRVEPFDNNHAYVPERNIVCWDYVESIAGRRFYGHFYDPNEDAVISDFVRFTGFNSGVSAFDVIPYDRLNYEIEVSTGNPGSVRGLSTDKGFLYVFKDDSIHSIYINESPETWVRTVLSRQDGLYAPRSLVRIPDGGVCFADSDAFKLVLNQKIINLTESNIRDTYYSLSGKADIIGWYDKIDGSVCFTNGVDTTTRIHYRGYRNASGFAWYKMVLPAAHYPEFVGVDRLSGVYFTNNHTDGFQGLFKWGRDLMNFGGSAIIPYFLTNVIILDESIHVLLDKFVLTKNGDADSGTLQNRVYVEGAVSQSWTAEDKSKTSLYQKLSPLSKRQGRRIQFEYNYGSSGEYSTDSHVQLDGIDIYGMAIQPPESSQ